MTTNQNISPQDLRDVLTAVAEAVAQQESALTELDSAIGDGDHGITMRLGFQAVVQRVGGLPPDAGIDAILGQSGRAFMGATGGAIGVILGKMLSSGKTALQGSTSIGPAELATWLGAMESSVTNSGKAKPGDKTILDAVHAAAESAAQSLKEGDSLAQMAARAAQAADAGAKSTANMLCKMGRASRLGERSLGHPDPGATSFAIILSAIARWLEQRASG